MYPVAGIFSCFAAVITRSGSPMVHLLSGNSGGLGACDRSPAALPPRAQSIMVSRSARDRLRSLRHLPKPGCANHGGMRCSSTTSAIAFAFEATFSYVVNENGASVPLWWQTTQCSLIRGAMSLAYVSDVLAGRGAGKLMAQPSTGVSFTD